MITFSLEDVNALLLFLSRTEIAGQEAAILKQRLIAAAQAEQAAPPQPDLNGAVLEPEKEEIT